MPRAALGIEASLNHQRQAARKGKAGPYPEETKLNYSMFFRLGGGGIHMFKPTEQLANSSQNLDKWHNVRIARQSSTMSSA